MSFLWKRIQRSGKKAAKFEFSVTYHELQIECSGDWHPEVLVVIWSHGSRHFKTASREWPPLPPVQGHHSTAIIWPEEETQTADITFFKEHHSKKYDVKEWMFSVECVSENHKRKLLGQASLNLVDCIGDAACDNLLKLKLMPKSSKIKRLYLEVSISARLLHESNESELGSSSSFSDLRSSPIDLPEHSSHSEGSSAEDESRCIVEHKKTVIKSQAVQRNVGELIEDDDDVFAEHDGAPNTVVRLPDVGDLPGEKELIEWCETVTEGYHGVRITNMASSWRSGLAFCAIIHRFHPELIDFASLSPFNILENNKQAFKAAQSLGIPPLLNPQEMVEGSTPDKLFVMTYVFQLKMHFDKRLDSLSLFTKKKKEERLAFHAPEAALAAVSEDSSSSSESSSDEDEPSDDDVEGDIYLGTKHWRVVSKPDALEEKKEVQDEEQVQQEKDCSEVQRKDAEGDDTEKLKQKREANIENVEEFTYTQLSDTRAELLEPLAASVLTAAADANEMTKEDDAHPVPKPKQPSEGGIPSMYAGIDLSGNVSVSSSEDELEVFTENVKAVDKSRVKHSPAVAKQSRVLPALPVERGKTTASPKRLANLPDKTATGSPKKQDESSTTAANPAAEALRKQELLARARLMMAAKEGDTNVPSLPERHAVSAPVPSPASVRKTTVTTSSVVASDNSRKPGESITTPPHVIETDIDADLPCRGMAFAMTPSPGHRSVNSGGERSDSLLQEKKKTQSQRRADGEGPSDAVADGRKIKKKFKEKKDRGDRDGSGHRKKKHKHKGETSAEKEERRLKKRRRKEQKARDKEEDDMWAKAELAKIQQRDEKPQRGDESRVQTVSLPKSAIVSDLQGWQEPSPSTAEAASPSQRSQTKGEGELEGDEELLDTREYVMFERRSIQQKQVELDRRGRRVEMRLRMAMSHGDKKEEDELMREWFQLVAQKNVLIRQNEDLKLLERQYELERKYALVSRKLRFLMSVEDHLKSFGAKCQEEALIKELTELVSERNVVAVSIHEAELVAEREDEEVQKAIGGQGLRDNADQKNCSIM